MIRWLFYSMWPQHALDACLFPSPILRETFFRQYARSGSCERAFRRAFNMRCGLRVHSHRTISRSCLVEGSILRSSLLFPHLPTPVPSLRMSSVSSHAKHIFPSPPSPQVSTVASLSARRRLVVDVSRVLERNPSPPNRADSVCTFQSQALHQRRLILSKLSSNTSTSSTLVDNAVRAILL